jgi:methionyl-tRNA formyltransferase
MNKIAFLGSKEVGYSALNYLIKNAVNLDVELVAVLSNDRKLNSTDKSVIQLAKSHHIPILQTADELIQISEIDFLISVQYHEILNQKHIDCAKKLAINLHMAPLPEYRGCNQFSFAIIDDAKEFGTTLHVLESGIDSGDILFESRFPIAEDETIPTLHQKTTSKSITLFEDTISDILTGNYTAKSQKSFYNIRPHNFHLRSEINDIKIIDLSWDEDKIDRYVRATYFPPFPSPYAVIDGEKVAFTLNWKKEIIGNPEGEV